MASTTKTQFVSLPSGIKVFYRSAGPANGSVVLLLHGFPSSSNEYRNLIPILANAGYRVIAPDLPGFGFTEVPSSLDYVYTFANIADTTASFLDELKISEFAVYIMDYGAPTGLRIALQRPGAITAIITQNGNAYEEGLGKDFWAPLRVYWGTQAGSQEYSDIRSKIKDAVLTYETTKWQYTDGEASPETIDPASYTLDWALLQRPGNFDIQLDLFRDYVSNVELYPKFHEYFRKTQLPVLAVWGKNDVCFVKEGALAFKKDLPNVRLELLDAGHFAGESHTEEIGKLMIEFLGQNGIKA